MSTVHDPITEAFIDESPVEVPFTVREKVQTPAGGYKWQEGLPLAPQTARLINSGTDASRTLEDGRVVIIEGTLVMRYDAVVKVGYLWKRADVTWEVLLVTRIQNWSTHAEMKLYG